MRTSLGRPARRVAHALLMGTVLVAGVIGCGSESGDGNGKDGSDTELGRALKSVPAALTDESVTFRDVTTARRLVAGNRELYAGLNGYGIPELLKYSTGDLKTDYGFDEKDVTTSLALGKGPTTRLTGTFAPDTISQVMTVKHGYTAAKDDAGVHLKKQGSPTLDVSDSARVQRESKDAPALPLTPPEKSVADDAAYQAVTGCLGEVYAATLYGKHTGKNKDVVLLGIGGRVGAKDSSSETLCAATASQEAAEATAKTLRDEATAPGKTYEGAKVTIGEGDTPVVSMTWRNKPDSGLKPGDADRYLKLPGLLLKLF